MRSSFEDMVEEMVMECRSNKRVIIKQRISYNA